MTNSLTHSLTHSPTHCVEQSRSWKASSSAATQKIPRIAWNTEVHYRIHKCRHLSLSWARSFKSSPFQPISLKPVSVLFCHLRLRPSGGLFPSSFCAKTLYASVLHPIHTRCLAHPILLYLTTRITFGKEYRWINVSLCCFLQYLLGPNVLCSALFSNTLIVCCSLSVRRPSSTPK